MSISWLNLWEKRMGAAAGRQHCGGGRRSRSSIKLALETLERRLVPTIFLNAGIPLIEVHSITGVGFRENVIATMSGTKNGVTDTNKSDFHALVNWGDGQWHPADVAPNTNGTAAATFLIKGDYVYDNAVQAQPIQVEVTGPDDPTPQPTQTALAFVTDMPSGIAGTIPPLVSYSLAPSNVTVSLNAGIPLREVYSYTDVGFRENVIASLSGTVNGMTDTNKSDFHAFVNYGDNNQWFPADIAPNTNGTIAATFLIKGDYVYDHAVDSTNPNPIVVYVMGPDGTSTSSETAKGFVSDMPSGIPGRPHPWCRTPWPRPT